MLNLRNLNDNKIEFIYYYVELLIKVNTSRLEVIFIQLVLLNFPIYSDKRLSINYPITF
jgi:hypothetical protein